MSISLKTDQCFESMLKKLNLDIKRNTIKTVQINIGKLCNQKCKHCHVNASPYSTENMSTKIVDRLLELLSSAPQVEMVDITGGAPELNPNFRYLIKSIKKMGKNAIDRTNLTVFFEPGQEDTMQFLADHQIQVFASLPCYTQENVDSQRGNGVFEKSIKALKLLNGLGYGKNDLNLILNLVYNTLGAYLPASQSKLENDYKTNLKKDFDIDFDNLITITNMPIGRFYDLLEKEGSLNKYINLLIDHFNPNIASKVMCTEMISISWDGYIYDCDFNQMLNIPIDQKQISLWDINKFDELPSKITFKDHCYGCTAGEGSSCKGSLINKDKNT